MEQSKRAGVNSFWIILCMVFLLINIIVFSGLAYSEEIDAILPGMTYHLNKENIESIENVVPEEGTSGKLKITSDGTGTIEEKDNVTYLDVESKLSLSYRFNNVKYPYGRNGLNDFYRWTLVNDTVVVSVYSSLNPDDKDAKWYPEIVEKEFNVKELCSGIDNFFETTDLQLINGCGYEVFVDYGVSKFIKSGKIFEDQIIDGISEYYQFYVHNSKVERNSTFDSSIEPRKVLGKKERIKKDSEYSKVQELTSDDPHYNWDIGKFVLNGYTSEASKIEDEIPIFLKNPGDKVTLWFQLDQDIDQLNENPKLEIAQDEGAVDRCFEIPKTNFKRGALIFQKTDYQGNKHKPIIYTDYLAACATTSADTRIQLFEEGDYEVALDYEIKDSSGKVLFFDTPRYFDYRIAFKFGIRNGNCKVTPFNLDGGSELFDGDITEKGFRIDTANSKYLELFVIKDSVIGTDDGWKLTNSFDRNSRDGKEYSDPGVYTIKVKNKYTGEKQKMTIFVGEHPIYKALAEKKLTIKKLSTETENEAEIVTDGFIIR